MAADDELTPTMKLKRGPIADTFELRATPREGGGSEVKLARLDFRRDGP